jgi:hypothetical protein
VTPFPPFRPKAWEPWQEASWRRMQVIWAGDTFTRLAKRPGPLQGYDTVQAARMAARLLETATVWQ